MKHCYIMIYCSTITTNNFLHKLRFNVLMYHYNTLNSRPVRTKFVFAILKTFTSVTIMYAMMNKCLKF